MAGKGKVENLKPFNKMSVEERKAISAKGVRAANKKIAEKKAMCELLKEYLGKVSELDPSKTVGEEYIAAVVAQMLCNPSVKDLETITRILGELVQKSEISADVKAEVSKPRLYTIPPRESK